MSNKRKSFDGHANSNKRPRHENGHAPSIEQPRQTSRQQLPPLPPITPKYEKMVYTHPSVVDADIRTGDSDNYDRIEFLGDAYLEVIASRLIFETYRELPTGRMAAAREMLVKNETLSEYAVQYGMDKKLRILDTSRPRNTVTNFKVNGDVFEAYVAAAILSDPVKGFEAVEDWLTALWQPKLKHINAKPTDMQSKPELANKIVARGVKLVYVDERPPIIDRGKGIETYFIGVYLTGWGYENQHLGSGTGLSKTAAGMCAAERALENHPLIDQLAAMKAESVMKKKEADALKLSQNNENGPDNPVS